MVSSKFNLGIFALGDTKCSRPPMHLHLFRASLSDIRDRMSHQMASLMQVQGFNLAAPHLFHGDQILSRRRASWFCFCTSSATLKKGHFVLKNHLKTSDAHMLYTDSFTDPECHRSSGTYQTQRGLIEFLGSTGTGRENSQAMPVR